MLIIQSENRRIHCPKAQLPEKTRDPATPGAFRHVAFPEPLGEKLYAEVKNFLESHGQSLYEAVSGPDVDILRVYHKHWSQFSQGSFYMNLLFGYLNTHLKKQKQDYGEISPYSTSFCPDTMEEVMDIGALALDIWKRKMIEPLKGTLVEHVLIEVKK
ncbi:Cullin-2 [Desmophyllum pertusum]|uniref:Cullin-2 n=1 Tax=Desmophyllum pertusum TaxID=174260 RepID=A0A9W9ZE99_9CNID|nr:Cullin-2 [Desmophyllum pertusum]